MTATLNGNRTISQDIETETLVIEAGSGREAYFVSWTSLDHDTGACANVRYVTTGETAHICSFRRSWLLPEPTVDEQDASDTRSITELRETVELRTNERDALTDSLTQAEDNVKSLEAALITERTNSAAAVQMNEDAWQRKLDRLWVALGDEADRRDWCSEYDDFAENNGGPRRREDVDAYCTVKVRSVLDGSDLISAMGADDCDEIDVEDPEVEVNWTFEMPSRSHTVRTGQCACESVDWRYAIEMQLRNIRYIDFEISSRRCDNCD